MARPTKYKKVFAKQLVEYFDQPNTYEVEETRYYQGVPYTVKVKETSELPTFERFGAEINVAVSTMWEWRKLYPEFSKAYKRAQQLQEALLVANSIMGRYQGPFAQFYLKNKYAYVDRAEVTGADGAPLMPTALDESILNRHLSNGGTPSVTEADSPK